MLSSDLTGLRLSDAQSLLQAENKPYSIVKIEPFFRGKPDPLEKGILRIVSMHEDPTGKIILTVCTVPEGSR